MTPQELQTLFEPLYGTYGLATGLARDTGYSVSQIRNLLKGRQPIKKHVEHHFMLWAGVRLKHAQDIIDSRT